MDFLASHYADVVSSCNETRYVKRCISRGELPTKFREELEPMGVKFHPDDLKYEESGGRCTLPQGWSMKERSCGGNTLMLLNENREEVFAISVSDNYGYQTWRRV